MQFVRCKMDIRNEITSKYVKYFYAGYDKLFPLFNWCGEFVCEKGFFISRSNPDFSMAIYTLNGQGTLMLNGNRYSLSKNSVAFLCKNDEYSYFPTGDSWHFKFVHFKGDVVHSILRETIALRSPVFAFLDINGSFDNIIECARIKADEKYAAESIFKLLHACYFGEQEQFGNPMIYKIKEFVKSNLSADLSVLELAKRVGLSRPYFTELFTKETGVSPTSYITEERLKYAKELLFTTDLPISEIATNVGYEDVSSFIRFFKKHMGKTPLDLRKSNPFS